MAIVLWPTMAGTTIWYLRNTSGGPISGTNDYTLESTAGTTGGSNSNDPLALHSVSQWPAAGAATILDSSSGNFTLLISRTPNNGGWTSVLPMVNLGRAVIPAGDWSFSIAVRSASAKDAVLWVRFRAWKMTLAATGGTVLSSSPIFNWQSFEEDVDPGVATSWLQNTMTVPSVAEQTFLASEYLHVEYWMFAAGGDITVNKLFSFNTKDQVIEVPTQTTTVSPVDVKPASIQEGASAAFLRFTAQANAGLTSLFSVILKKQSTVADASLVASLWRSTDTTWSAADTFLVSGKFSGGLLSLTAKDTLFSTATTPLNYFVTLNPATGTSGFLAGVNLQSLRVSQGNVGTTGLPTTLASIPVTCSTSCLASLWPVNQRPSFIREGDTQSFVLFSVTSNTGGTAVTLISLKKAAGTTVTDANLSARLYKSSSRTDTLFSTLQTTNDTLLAGPYAFGTSNGAVLASLASALHFTGLNELVSTTTFYNYFITLTPTAGSGSALKSAGVEIVSFAVATGVARLDRLPTSFGSALVSANITPSLVSVGSLGSLQQLTRFTLVSILPGGTTPNPDIVLRAGLVSDADLDSVKLQVEFRLTGSAFDGTVTGESLLVSNQTKNVTVTLTSLSDANYHWRARLKDNLDSTSDWVLFPIAQRAGERDDPPLASTDVTVVTTNLKIGDPPNPSPSPFNPDGTLALTSEGTLSYAYQTYGAMTWLRVLNTLGSLVSEFLTPSNCASFTSGTPNCSTANRTAGSYPNTFLDSWIKAKDKAGAISPDADYPFRVSTTAFVEIVSTTAWGGPRDVAVPVNDPTTIWVTDSTGLYRSTDRGTLWSLVSSFGSASLEGLTISDDGQELFVADDTNNVLRHSTDGGVTWSSLAAPGSTGTDSASDVSCTSTCDKVWFANGAGGTVYLSTDHGATWTSKLTGLGADNGGVAVKFDGTSVVATSAKNDDVYLSTDGGTTWSKFIDSANSAAQGGVNHPVQAAFEAVSGGFWVSDQANFRLQFYDPGLNLNLAAPLTSWIMTVGKGSAGGGPYTFETPTTTVGLGITAFNLGGQGQPHLYVADTLNNQLQHYVFEHVSGPSPGFSVNHPPIGVTLFSTCTVAGTGSSANCAQQEDSWTNVIKLASATTGTTVYFLASVVDASSLHTVKLEVELQSIGTTFNGTYLYSSASFASSGSFVTLQVTPPFNHTDYHWQARGKDSKGSVGLWSSFGSNNEASVDLRIANNTPDNPTLQSACSLPGFTGDCAQLKANQFTEVPVGGLTSESKVILWTKVTEPTSTPLRSLASPETVKLQAEVRALGTSFSCSTFTLSSTWSSAFQPCVESPLVAGALTTTGVLASVVVNGLTDTGYHWRARAVDKRGNATAFISFGYNSEDLASDFQVLNSPPSVPTGADQFKIDGATSIAVGGTNNTPTLVFKATVTDPDVTDTVLLRVETCPVYISFGAGASAGCLTGDGPLVAREALASVTVSGHVLNSSYHWQFRAVDDRGKTGLYSSFGGNAETAADYTITNTQPGLPNTLSQLTFSGAVIAIGGLTSVGTVRIQGIILESQDTTDTVRLEVEARPTSGLNSLFSNAPTAVGAFVASGAAAETVLASLPSANYHWQARIMDSRGSAGLWSAFGGNAESATDFGLSDGGLPARIVSLRVESGSQTSGSLRLLWEAPGNNGPGTTADCPAGTYPNGCGNASAYDLRQATKPIVETGALASQVAFADADLVTGLPTPSSAGTLESVLLSSLPANAAYYFAIAALDSGGLSSTLGTGYAQISNVVNATSDPYTPTKAAPAAPLPLTQLRAGDFNTMIGMPLTSTNLLAAVLFAGAVGLPVEMNVWESTGLGNNDGSWLASDRVAAGRGYFFTAGKNDPPGTSLLNPPGTAVSFSTVTVRVNRGWNLLANPYPLEVRLDSLCIARNQGAGACSGGSVDLVSFKSFANALASNWVGNATYYWNGATYDAEAYNATPPAALRPWRGYWLWVRDNDVATCSPCNLYSVIIPRP